jgi:hypothetical protein
MRFGKAIKRIIALGTGATMMGATLFGAMAADLSNYPSPFIKDGKFNGVMVIGDKAAAEDVIGVSDIAVSLQYSATQAAGSTTTDVTVEGDAWKVGTSTNTFEMSENLEGTATNRETIADIVSQSYITDDELPGTLADGTASNSKGDADYNQRLYFEDTTTGYVFFTEDDNDVTADFLYFENGRQISRYELEFTSSLESDVDDSTGSATTSGLYLTDLEDVELQLLGKSYSIVQARRLTSTGSSLRLTLMGGAVKDTLLEGETKTYTVDGKDYETTLDFVSSTQVKFTINGESTRLLKDGDTDKLSDGTEVGVSEILYQDYAGGIHSGTFFIGAQKMELRDDLVTDSAYDHELTVADETIDGAYVIMEGTDDNTTFKLDKIVVNMTADDDFYVPAGAKLSENSELAEPEVLFTKNWDVEYLGLNSVDTDDIKINPKGSDDYELEFIDGSGDKTTVPIVNCVSSSTIKFGDDDDDLINEENQSITKNDYFIIVNENEQNGERASYVLRYRGADKSTADNPIIKFDNMGSGERIERPMSIGSQLSGYIGPGGIDYVAEIGELKLGGATYKIYNTSSTAADDYSIVVDLSSTNNIKNNRVAPNTKYGAEIQIINATYNGDVVINISTVNSEHYDDLAPNSFVFNITGSSGEVRMAHHPGDIFNWKTPEEEENTEYTYSSYGAKAKFDSPTNDPQSLLVEYPKEQRVPLVYVTGKGASLSATTVASETAVVVNRIEVGATKLASEVPDITAVNAILVGGPCANAAAADIMGNPADCTEGFEAGKGLIKLYENDGNVAMLVAGYAAADTRAAAKVVANYADYADDLVGDAVEVTTATMGITEVTEAAPADEEETE